MKRSLLFWILAVLITLISAAYQRLTGPTYPLSGTTEVGGQKFAFRFDRSHGGDGDHEVRLMTHSPDVTGKLEWKRYKTDDPWTTVDMRYNDGALTAMLPHQPPAGKLEYKVHLRSGDHALSLPANDEMVIRFKGDVPLFILIPHVLAMFFGMLVSTRAGLELFGTGEKLRSLTYWTLGLLGLGGLVLGPIVQKYAFGEYWTGWPYGYDLTDNKTLVAFLVWAVAATALQRGHYPRRWAFGAAMVTLIVFMIPHSVLGSELKYEERDGRMKPAGQMLTDPRPATDLVASLKLNGSPEQRNPSGSLRRRL